MGIMDFFKKGKEEPVEKNIPESNDLQRTYTIQSGDSLSKIAKREYGDAQKWNVIYEANRDTIKNPDLIHPGQEIVIPNLSGGDDSNETKGSAGIFGG